MFGRRMRAIARIPDVTTALSHYLLSVRCLRHRPIGKIARKLREIQIDKAGTFLFVSNRGHDSIAIFSIDKAAGTLRAAGHTPTGGKTPHIFAGSPPARWRCCRRGAWPKCSTKLGTSSRC